MGATVTGAASVVVPSLEALVAQADGACADWHAAGLAAAVLPIVALAPVGLAIDLVAVVELARHDPELAIRRWTRLRGQLWPLAASEPTAATAPVPIAPS